MLDKQMHGMVSVEQEVTRGLIKDATLGIQIGHDGRVWICLNGQAWIRFTPQKTRTCKYCGGILTDSTCWECQGDGGNRHE
jgi:hypothetical protein